MLLREPDPMNVKEKQMQHTDDTRDIAGVQKPEAPSGRRALITGASSGLGIEFAELLAAQKMNLVLAARRKEPMEKLAEDLRRRHGVDILVEPIDLAAPGAAARLKDSLNERAIQIDILVNNAGYGLQGEFLKTPIERTTDMIQLNITALTELSYVFGRDMAARGSGEILLIASLLAFQPVPTYAAYAATKSYVLSFGEALHDELRTQGVVVTSLCPGHTETGFDAAAGAQVSPMLRLLTMKPRPVAEAGLEALAKGKASVIAGFMNKVVAFSTRLTPRSMQRASMRKVMVP
ncbi:SDR family oxidoreductase [Agrobacterium fabrum]|jgi:short-subunit dehydrogenase|uniref:Short-chain dehydrogenase n=3 Tax=Agrobacterium fabrum TaxID=1176649 RepID=A9CG86_AGRFC|nr:short-chain dehydrogenase [Agrobacterium fabrum str. C58]QRM61789.1 SDR family oxidoreductase [Agrobacterium fabrum]TRB28831.1 SDR family oxidoreductase [Agrobacterium fabrum]